MGRKRQFTDKQEKEVCNEYIAGFNITELAEKYSLNLATVYNMLVRNSVPRRPVGRKPRFSSEQEKMICDEYTARTSTYNLGKKYDVNSSTISRILIRNNVPRRSTLSGDAIRKLSAEQERQVCNEYIAGANTCTLGKNFGVSNSTIDHIRKRNGVSKRPYRKFSAEQEKSICEEYTVGANPYRLSEKYNASRTGIIRILKRNDVSIRSKRGAPRKLVGKP